MEFCPQCQERVDEIFLNRLIQDACGHKKCRKCLLNEEHGCRTCSESKLKTSAVSIRTGLPSDAEMSGYDGATNSHHELNRDTDDFHMTTLENAVPHHPKGQVKSPEISMEASNETVIFEKKKIISKKCAARSNSCKSKVKRKPLHIPGYVTVSESTPKFTCTLCNKSFTTKLHIRYHSYCNGLSKPFKCLKCDKEFITKSHYQYHIRNHEGSRPYVCLKCGKSFNQQGKLTRHSRSHLEEKTFVCSTCGHRFKNLDGLKSHAKIHSGIKAHHCTLCNKQFSELANLKKHSITHKGEKNFMCDECGKSFGSKSTLNTHVHTHSKARPHVCNSCGRAFSLRKDLKRHETTHLPLKPFNCQLCNQAFRRRDNFDRHMKNTHPESTLPPIIQPLPRISSNEKPTILSSEEQAHPVTVSRKATPERDMKRKSHSSVTGTDKIGPNSNDNESNCYRRAPTETHPTLPDYESKKLDHCNFHNAKDDVKPTTVHEVIVGKNYLNTAKLDVGTECVTQKDPTSRTALAKVINESQPRLAVYQAVPVINRTTISSPSMQSNVATSSIIKMGSSLARAPYDGTNCVRTITCTSNAQRILLPTTTHQVEETPVNVRQPETIVSTDKIPNDQDQSNLKILKNDPVSPECSPKPKLRLYLSDLHWRKRTMELLNLRNELKADSLVYDKSLEKVDDIEEANSTNPVTNSERIEFCNSPKSNYPDDHGTYYSKQTFYKVSNQPGEILVKGTQQKYLPHNRLRHIHPKSIVYNDPRPQPCVYQRTRVSEAISSGSGPVIGQTVAHVDLGLHQPQQHTTGSQAKNVIVENKIGNVRPSV